MKSRFVATTLTMVATLTLVVEPSKAQNIVASSEIWIDGPDDVQPGNDRNYPDSAVDNQGRRIHVWSAFTSETRSDIYLRRFDAAGNPLENPKLVNTTTVSDQTLARVAVAGNGSFLVIYQSDEPVEEGVERPVIRSQLFDPNGNPVGFERKLNATPTDRATDAFADVAALRTPSGLAGGYAVVWASNSSAGTDSNLSIQGCVVSPAGVPGAQFQVNLDEAGFQDHPSVTGLADGGFLATWTSQNQIVGRRFDAAGTPDGADFVISTGFVEQKLANDAAIGWNGSVAVVWADAENSGDGREVRARLFDADLNPMGSDFRVNTLMTDEQSEPRVADYGPAGFLVVWESDVASGADQADSIEARLITGTALGGPQVQFNVWDGSGSNQNHPGAQGWYGRLSASWRSYSRGGDPPPVPNTDDHIIGRDIEHCVFCDDLEWGSTWRWSATTP